MGGHRSGGHNPPWSRRVVEPVVDVEVFRVLLLGRRCRRHQVVEPGGLTAVETTTVAGILLGVGVEGGVGAGMAPEPTVVPDVPIVHRGGRVGHRIGMSVSSHSIALQKI